MPRNQRGGQGLAWRIVFHAYGFDIETVGLHSAEQLLDRPTASIEVGNLKRRRQAVDGARGDQAPVDVFTLGRVDFAHVDEIDGDRRGVALGRSMSGPHDIEAPMTDGQFRLARRPGLSRNRRVDQRMAG